MSISQFKEVVEFVQNHHSFVKWRSDEERKKEVELYPKLLEYGYNIKYVDCCYDSRTSDVWMIKFRGFNKFVFSTKSFVGITDKDKPKEFPFNSLFDWIMSFLKGEWYDEKVLKQCEMSD